MSLAELAPLLAQTQTTDRSTDSCPGNNGVCPGWVFENFDRYMEPLREHVVLVVVSVVAGFIIAFTLALIAHRARWTLQPISLTTQVLYTIPSIAAFFILQPIVGRGFAPAVIALTVYTLFILFANITAGLQNVPDDIKDAARGMGLTENQLLRQVELPLAMPEILAGLRIATTTTIGLTALVFFAGAGGLGEPIVQDKEFTGNVLAAGGLCLLLAAISDLLLLGVQRIALPWRRVGAT